MHQKMQNCLPVKVTHANREKIVGFNVFESYLGPPAHFVRHCRMKVNIFNKIGGKFAVK